MKIIFSFILCILLTSCNSGEDEIYILPKNYTGYVIIVFNQKNGAEPKYEDKSRVYTIPENGILKTQWSDNSGWTNFPKFYYEKIAPENIISFIAEPKNIPLNTVVASGGTTVGANKDLAGKEVVRYVRYYIGNKIQTEKAFEEAEKLDVLKLAE